MMIDLYDFERDTQSEKAEMVDASDAHHFSSTQFSHRYFQDGTIILSLSRIDIPYKLYDFV